MKMTARMIVAGAAVMAVIGMSSGRLVGGPPAKGIHLTPLGVYTALDADGKVFFDKAAVEISAFDPVTARAFVTFGEAARVDIVSLANPTSPVLFDSIDLTPWGAEAHATSVAVSDGVLVVAIPQGEKDTAPGIVAFFTTAGVLINEVTVGTLPDMLTFTPNGQFLLTANEGQPNDAYDFDPEGSISLIDLRGGVDSLTGADVTEIGFDAFNGATLDPSIRIFGPGATVAQDLEPEYIAVSHDSRTAWVTLQENNAIATIDLTTRKVIALRGLGFKDHSVAGRGLDASVDGKALIVTRPVLGMYQPDAIATFRSGNQTYLVTANEGDVRDYDGFEEAVEVEDITLDPIAFPDAVELKKSQGIGKLKVTRTRGDSDGDGEYETLYAFGARSFSIWSPDGTLRFDSGDALEQITKAAYPLNFNASSTNNTLDNRSDDKGPEPEGVTVASLFGRTYIFVVLERIGGVVVYEASNPAAPMFVQYINTRNFSAAANTAAAGDRGAEAARVIPAEQSPNGKPLLIVSNEVSGSLRVFEIAQEK